MSQGICVLCDKDKPIRKSHLISKAIFNLVRDDVGVLLSRSDQKTTTITDRQIVARMLCGECEQLFGRKGEYLCIPLLLQKDSSFPLYDLIQREIRIPNNQYGNWVDPENLSNAINVDSLLYFAISLFWRASAGNWPMPAKSYMGALGKKYEKLLKEFLLGKSELHKNVLVTYAIDNDHFPLPLIKLPDSIKKAGFRMHWLMLPGVHIVMFVGNQRSFWGEMATKHNSQLFLVERSLKATPLYDILATDLSLHEKKGKYANLTED